ncbi:MAG: 50S ribosomal protein L29 [Flavobacteriaceae bacterium]|nr:50S ribosomal protein L29 [Flavobacteriaceae bacterium]
MKQSEIKELSVADLHEELDKARKELSNLKMTHAISPLENPMQIRASRRTIARLATEITKRELD